MTKLFELFLQNSFYRYNFYIGNINNKAAYQKLFKKIRYCSLDSAACRTVVYSAGHRSVSYNTKCRNP